MEWWFKPGDTMETFLFFQLFLSLMVNYKYASFDHC